MAALRNKRNLVTINRENHDEQPRNSQARDTNFPRIKEDYIIQMSEETEGRVTKKLSQEFSGTESRILGALSKLDEFLLNPQVQVHSGSLPETSRNLSRKNQESNEHMSTRPQHTLLSLQVD